MRWNERLADRMGEAIELGEFTPPKPTKKEPFAVKVYLSNGKVMTKRSATHGAAQMMLGSIADMAAAQSAEVLKVVLVAEYGPEEFKQGG